MCCAKVASFFDNIFHIYVQGGNMSMTYKKNDEIEVLIQLIRNMLRQGLTRDRIIELLKDDHKMNEIFLCYHAALFLHKNDLDRQKMFIDEEPTKKIGKIKN